MAAPRPCSPATRGECRRFFTESLKVGTLASPDLLDGLSSRAHVLDDGSSAPSYVFDSQESLDIHDLELLVNSRATSGTAWKRRDDSFCWITPYGTLMVYKNPTSRIRGPSGTPSKSNSRMKKKQKGFSSLRGDDPELQTTHIPAARSSL